MACTIFEVDPLVKQKLFRLIRTLEDKLLPGSTSDPILDRPEFNIKNLTQVFVAQAAEDDNLVDPVHKLGRELAPGRFNCGPIDLLINFRVDHPTLRRKPDTTRDQFTHLTRPQIGGHNDDRTGEIDPPVVSERERRLVENPEEKLPESVTGLLDLVEQDQRESGGIGVRTVDILLRQHRGCFAVAKISGR